MSSRSRVMSKSHRFTELNWSRRGRTALLCNLPQCASYSQTQHIPFWTTGPSGTLALLEHRSRLTLTDRVDDVAVVITDSIGNSFPIAP